MSVFVCSVHVFACKSICICGHGARLVHAPHVCVCVSVSCSSQMPQMCFRGTELHVACGFGPARMKSKGGDTGFHRGQRLI